MSQIWAEPRSGKPFLKTHLTYLWPESRSWEKFFVNLWMCRNIAINEFLFACWDEIRQQNMGTQSRSESVSLKRWCGEFKPTQTVIFNVHIASELQATFSAWKSRQHRDVSVQNLSKRQTCHESQKELSGLSDLRAAESFSVENCNVKQQTREFKLLVCKINSELNQQSTSHSPQKLPTKFVWRRLYKLND